MAQAPRLRPCKGDNHEGHSWGAEVKEEAVKNTRQSRKNLV